MQGYDLIMYGDSETGEWEWSQGSAVYAKYFGKYNGLNAGITGASTCGIDYIQLPNPTYGASTSPSRRRSYATCKPLRRPAFLYISCHEVLQLPLS